MKPSLVTLLIVTFISVLFSRDTEPSDSPTIEQIFPERWVQELLSHPLRVTFHLADPKGTIHHGEHRFAETPHSLDDEQSDLAARTFSRSTAFSTQTTEELLQPDALLRFENEQQTIDLVFSSKSRAVSCYLNGEFSIAASTPAISLSPEALQILQKLFKAIKF